MGFNFHYFGSLLSGVLVIAALKPDSVLGLNAIVNQPVAWSKLGQDVELFCSSGRQEKLEICRWRKSPSNSSDEQTIVVTESGDTVMGSLIIGNYSYAGPGMTTGECGLKIHNVAEEQVGTWGCTLIGSSIWIGYIEVALYEKPSSPTIHDQDLRTLADLGEGANSSAVCCVHGGKPIDETNLSYEYDGCPVVSTLHKTPEAIPCIKWENHFTVLDIGKRLKCTVNHPGILEGDALLLSTEVTIDVKFPPVWDVADDLAVDFSNASSSDVGNVTFRIRSNPKAKVQLLLREARTATGIEVENYSVHVRNTSVINEYEYVVNITNPMAGNLSYILKVSNGYGFKEVGLKIASPEPEQPAAGEASDSNSNYWIMVTVGIVMSLLFLLIILYVLNTVARKRGWFCYKGRTRNYPVADANTNRAGEDEYFTAPRYDAADQVVKL